MKNRDEEILYHLSQCNLLTRDHIAELTGRDDSWLYESLNRMVRQKKIYCKDRGRWLPRVYARYDISKRESFDHDLSLADLYTRTFLSRILLDWSQPKQKLEDDLNQDCNMLIQAGERELDYRVEYETGKNSWNHVVEVFKRYIKIREEEKIHALFILRDESRKKLLGYVERAKQLLEANRYPTYRLDEPSTHKLFLFVLQDEYMRNPTAEICTVPGHSKRYSISPHLIKQSANSK